MKEQDLYEVFQEESFGHFSKRVSIEVQSKKFAEKKKMNFGDTCYFEINFREKVYRKRK